MQDYPLITIVGGSGFVGRHLVKQLAAAGYRLRILSRDAVGAEYLKTAATIGQIATQYADITKPETLAGKFDGSFAVINLASTLQESGRQKFAALNVDGAKAVAAAAKQAGASRFIHVSALGVDHAKNSTYACTKLAGEDAVRQAFAGATIVRPSLIVGPEDGFFQRFGRMSLLAPALPLIYGGKTRFQPTLVSDVAHAIATALATPDSIGKTYELGGAEIFSFKALLERMRAITNRRFCLVSIPAGMASFMGRVASAIPLLPAPITADQVRLLAYDNVLSGQLPGYAALGMEPQSVSAALPQLLARFIKR
jgi:uncharacterized protein YbjT (DUF2867 family)